MKSAEKRSSSGVYLPALDSLRFFAFLAVFLHHADAISSPLIQRIISSGWAGVDLFFVISSFLFFTLFEREYRLFGQINFREFFARRLLRIYPLMITFPVAVLLAYLLLGKELDFSVMMWRLIGLSLFVDNFYSFVADYSPIPFAAHLWTLSFEFQIYAVIPFLFLLFKTVSLRKFLIGLLIFWILALLGRSIAELLEVPHPVVWVAPFLRPDSILIGIVLSTGVLARVPTSAIFLTLLASVAFVLLNPRLETGTIPSATYVGVALACGCLVWLAVYNKSVQWLLKLPLLSWLGKVSFGLYVYHLLAIHIASKFVFGAPSSVVALGLTIVFAALSYYLFEFPFPKLKQRFTKISTRPI